ncbi:MAG: insulinase family protein [Nanoarchaeota archaeon]|nr:insulinase family protein [Nanoarchaeota archaeon]
MKLVKSALSNNIPILVYISDLFKTTSCCFNSYTKSNKNNFKRGIATSILINGTLKYPTLQKLNVVTDQQFCTYYTGHSTFADLSRFHSGFSALTDSRIVGRQNTFENSLEIFSDVLLNPLNKSSSFIRKYFEKEKMMFANVQKEFYLNKEQLAYKRFLDNFLQGEEFNIGVGMPEDLEEITARNSFEEFQRIKDEYPKNIIVVTHLDEDLIIRAFDNALGSLPTPKKNVQVGKPPKKVMDMLIIDDTELFNQSMVYVGYPLKNIKKRKEISAMKILNSCIATEIFEEVRLKRELAYMASANYNIYAAYAYGIAGVEPQNVQMTIDSIIGVYDKILKKGLTKASFKAQKKIIISTHKIKVTNKQYLKSLLFSLAIEDRLGDFENFVDWFSEVSYEDVLEVRKKFIGQPTAYCLRNTR